MKAKIAAIAVIGLLTLSVIAVGLSAINAGVGDVQSSAPAAAAAESAQDGDGNAAVTTFNFVCPFH